MTTPQNIFIQELDNFISNAGYATNTVPITRLNDLETLKNLAIQAGCFTGESLEKFRLVLSQRLEMKDKDVENEIRKLRVRQALGQYPADIKEYVDLFIKGKKLNYQLIGDYKNSSGDDVPSGVVRNMLMELDADLRLYGDSRLNAAISNYEFNAHRQAFGTLLDTIPYDCKGGDAPIERILETIVDDDVWSHPDFRKAAIAVFRLWIWRVKTILAGRCTTEHILLYLYGPQGCGKTTFTEWFLQPFKNAKMGAGLDLFSDNGKTGLIAKLPVIVFEETAFADRASVENIKQRMTETHTMVRDLYQSATSKKVTASFFACSNRLLETIIRDETGMRRFFQLNVKVIPHGTWDGHDPFEVWRCVDENQLQPPLTEDERAAIAKYQEQHRSLSIVERWLRDTVVDLDNAGLINAAAGSTQLYDRFKDWCDAAGEKRISQNQWARDLKLLPNVTALGHGRYGQEYHITMTVPEVGEPRRNILRLVKKYND